MSCLLKYCFSGSHLGAVTQKVWSEAKNSVFGTSRLGYFDMAGSGTALVKLLHEDNSERFCFPSFSLGIF